jgi:hypothetical protein
MADFVKFLDRNFREIRSGLVSLGDFQEYLQGLGVPADVREQCKKDLADFDHEGNGEINFEDFQEWFKKLPVGYLSKLLRRMAEEEHIQIKRESVARDEVDPESGARPVIRAMFKISDRNDNQHVTKPELIELMNNFDFSGLEQGDEDWVELEDDEDVSFDEFYEWWTIDGTFKYTGGGIFASIQESYKHFQNASGGSAVVTVSKQQFTGYFTSIGASPAQIADALVMFDKADMFDSNTAGITFSSFAALLQDSPDAIHKLLRNKSRVSEQSQYRKTEKVTAESMFKKYESKKGAGTVKATELDALLTEYGIGKVDMSEEDIQGDVEFDGIYAWWTQEGRYKQEEATKGVVGLRGLMYVHKHFVEPEMAKGNDLDLVALKEFYSYLLHSNISEWALQLTIGCLEPSSESDIAASVKTSYREFVARIGDAPPTVIILLRKSARETLPPPTAEQFDDVAATETFDVPVVAETGTTKAVSTEGKRAVPATTAPAVVDQPMVDPVDPVRSGWKWQDKDGVTYYLNNTLGNWGLIILALLVHWTILGLMGMGLIAATTEYGLNLLYIYLIALCITVIVVISVVVVGTVESSKQKTVFLEDKPLHLQDRKSLIRSKA